MAIQEEIDGEALDAELDKLQRKLDRLRVLYEQFFLGTEKTPPHQLQKEVVRMVYKLQQLRVTSASGKFRLQSLIQRFNAHKAYWGRTIREIEEGRYRRQTFRAQQRKRTEGRDDDPLTTEDYLAIRMIKDQQGEEAAEAAAEERRQKRRAEEADAASAFMDQLEAGRGGPAVSEPVTAATRRKRADEKKAAAAASGDAGTGTSTGKRSASEIRGMSADDIAGKADKLRELRRRMQQGSAEIAARRGEAPQPAQPARPPVRDVDREVYDRFVAAKRNLNQDTGKLSFDAVKQSLAKQRAKVRQKHDCARVDFDVVVKDGNAFLKPIPVKDA